MVGLIRLVGIEVVGYQEDPAMFMGSALDATYPVSRDWCHYVLAGSLPPPHAHS